MTFRLFVVALYIMLTSFLVEADQVFVSSSERFKNAAFVVEASVTSFHAIKFQEEKFPRKVAVASVSKVLKGVIKEKSILISVGNYWPDGLVNSQDIEIEIAVNSLWFLHREESGLCTRSF